MNQDPESFLLNCFDFERERSSRRKNKPFTLSRVQKALGYLNHPERDLKVIHIAGTKGKGSTLEYLYRGLQTCGVHRVGLFTSPHYVSICERIRIDDNNIGYDDFKKLALQITELNQTEFDGDLSFFECLFLIAILYFKQEGLRQIILETGLGGRLDATNSIHSDISVLTRIDYDHTEILGEQLHQIAREKAGIIKQNGLVFALRQANEVNEVFEKVAITQQAKLVWVELNEGPARLSQAVWENSLLAKAVLDELYRDASPPLTFYHQIALKGRLQKINYGDQDFLLDGAHNRISMSNLKQAIQNLGLPVQCAFAMGDSRSPTELLQALDDERIVEYNFFDLPGGRPGLDPEKILEEFQIFEVNKSAQIHTSLQQWCNTPFQGVKLVTGSIYLVGEALKVLRKT